MTRVLVKHIDESPLIRVILDDPDHRNALTINLFDALLETLRNISDRSDVNAILLSGAGSSFCAGFDLGAVVEEPMILDRLIERLSETNRLLRRMPQIVVIAAHGAAIAGGCALLSAADVVFVGDETQGGYPVHALGVSPAVTIPTLRQAIGDGQSRALLLSGQILKGKDLQQLGLATHLAAEADVQSAALNYAREAAQRPAGAMRATKQWINTLDGSLEDSMFDGPVAGSAELTGGREAREMLEAFWNRRSSS